MPRSPFWQYFEKQQDNFVVCKLCSKRLKTSGNTSNLKCHLNSRHAGILKSHLNTEQADLQPRKKVKRAVADPQPNSPSTSSTITIIRSPSPVDSDAGTGTSVTITNESNDEIITEDSQHSVIKQPSIWHSFSDINSWQVGGQKYLKMTNAILFMICNDYQPLSLVENAGFKNLLKTAAPLYKIPSRKTVTNLLENKFKALSNLFSDKIKTIDSYTITTDIWTETFQTRSYLGVTLHFCENAEMNAVTLGVYELEERHTSEYIIEKLRDICENWNVECDKVTVVVTDGAANITKAIDMGFGKKRHVHCFAHQLNLVAEKSIKSVEELCRIIAEIKAIVTWFKQSVLASDELRKLQKESGNEKKLIQEVSTRWNSTYEMIVRFLELREPVNSIINKHPTAPVMITAREIKELQAIVKLLQPLKAATDEISGQKYTTSSLVIPMVFNLERKIDEVVCEGIATNLKNALLKEITKRLSSAEQVHILAISTILDPRFKKVYFKNPVNAGKTVQLIQDLIETTAQEQGEMIEQPHSPEANASTTDKTFSLWEDHDRFIKQMAGQTTETSVSEISLYLKSPNARLEENPLKWWERNSHLYPKLKKIAFKYLATVATSVPSEQLFSKAGQTITQQRNRIKGKRLSQLLFLKSIDTKFWEL